MQTELDNNITDEALYIIDEHIIELSGNFATIPIPPANSKIHLQKFWPFISDDLKSCTPLYIYVI